MTRTKERPNITRS